MRKLRETVASVQKKTIVEVFPKNCSRNLNSYYHPKRWRHCHQYTCSRSMSREEGTTTTAPPERKVSAAQTEAAVPVVTVVLAVQETETELERDEEERKFDVANVLCDRIF